ncbi:MAG TPA: penicillin-binding protein, partial [Reyranella sp.]
MFDSSPELRVGPAERSAPEPDRPAPRPRRKKSKKKSARGGGGGKRRPLILRLTYWGLVACLWLVIGVAGVVAYVGAHLPPIQSLEIPKRPPTIQINDINGKALARRGDMAGEVILLKDLPPYVPRAFVAIE